MIITIDGPSATGKSSVARKLAQKLGIMHLNSGLLYRALAYLLTTRYGYDDQKLSHPQREDVARCLDFKRCVYTYDAATSRASVTYDGQDITSFLMTKEIDMQASLVAVDFYVHEVITAFLRRLGVTHDLVTDGRDTGSVVFPDATIKFFLTASVDIRAERWLKDRGNGCSLEDARAYISKRDLRDSSRAAAPLIVPVDAQVIDTSYLDIEAVCARMLEIIHTV